MMCGGLEKLFGSQGWKAIIPSKTLQSPNLIHHPPSRLPALGFELFFVENEPTPIFLNRSYFGTQIIYE